MTLHHGDCLDVLPTLDAESIDAIVTDPPYGLAFMGKHWDHGLPGEDFWAAMLRVAKPGAHLLAFGGTRTYHRLASAIEDAGWEIRDTLVWAYASGFPKSLDVSKAIDKAAGAERERPRSLSAAGEGFDPKGTLTGVASATQWCESCGKSRGSQAANCQCDTRGVPATAAAREWQGWGTALKPAWEPIVLARKPLRGTVAANVQAYGTGALNIDATRIGFASDEDRRESTEKNAHATFGSGPRQNAVFGFDPADRGKGGDYNPPGRWPANVILTDPIFDGDTPGVVGGGETSVHDTTPGGQFIERHAESLYELGHKQTKRPPGRGDSGTYSRFFLIPKADRADREPVLGGLPDGIRVSAEFGGEAGRPGRSLIDGEWVNTANPRKARANVHPTVKPTDLMRHLVRLVTPPGGLVLDPFMGSGTTALACEMEGFRWVGIEREAEYIAIAEARLNGTQKGLGLVG